MYRELGYGAMFFICAMAGAASAAWIAWGLSFDFPEHAAEWALHATPYGAVPGALAWLVFRYTRLKSPRSQV